MNECSCSDGLCRDCALDMRTVILRVRQLHMPIKRSTNGIEVCKGCTQLGRIGQPHNPGAPGVAYPCATITALGGAG